MSQNTSLVKEYSEGVREQEKSRKKSIPTAADNAWPAPTSLRSIFTLHRRKRPLFLQLRNSKHFITFVVGYGIFVDLCIYGIASPVIPFRLRELGYDNVNALTGWLVAAYGGGLIVSSPPIGYLGERIKNRQIPLLVCLVFMAGSLVMFMLSTSFTLLVVSRVLQGVSGTGIFTIGMALLADSVPEADIALSTGQAMMGLSLGALAGPPIGGALYQKLGYYAPWIFCIIIVAVDFIFRLLVVENGRASRWIPRPVSAADTEAAALDGNEEGQHRGKSTNLSAFLALLVNLRALVSSAISLSLGVYMGGLLDAAMTLRLNQRYGLDSLQAGLIFIASAVPALVLSPVAGSLVDRFGPKRLALASLSGAAVTTAFLCIDMMPLAGFIVVLVFVGGSATFALPAITADLTYLVNDTKGLGYSHAFALFNMAYSVGSFIGPIVAGQALEALGTKNGWFVMVGLVCGSYLLCIPGAFLKLSGPRPKASLVGSSDKAIEESA